MIILLYSNIDIISDHDLDYYLSLLPKNLEQEILKYSFLRDRKLRLMARLMLFDTLKSKGLEDLVFTWERDKNNKPFINNWKQFNISHSEKWVLLAYGDSSLGIDIEKNKILDYSEIIQYFHPRERQYIFDSDNINAAFYEIWVKKESLLKAIGQGLINDLNQFDCVGNQVEYNGFQWYLHPVLLVSGYTSFVCSSTQEEIITKPYKFELI